MKLITFHFSFENPYQNSLPLPTFFILSQAHVTTLAPATMVRLSQLPWQPHASARSMWPRYSPKHCTLRRPMDLVTLRCVASFKPSKGALQGVVIGALCSGWCNPGPGGTDCEACRLSIDTTHQVRGNDAKEWHVCTGKRRVWWYAAWPFDQTQKKNQGSCFKNSHLYIWWEHTAWYIRSEFTKRSLCPSMGCKALTTTPLPIAAEGNKA